jgi:hypothetical protein
MSKSPKSERKKITSFTTNLNTTPQPKFPRIKFLFKKSELFNKNQRDSPTQSEPTLEKVTNQTG